MKAHEKWDLVMLNSKTLKDCRVLICPELRIFTNMEYYKISLSEIIRAKQYVAKYFIF